MSDKPRKDDPEVMAQMERWLTQVADLVEVDHSFWADHKDELLKLISAVAHGPSRPGAPLTAFLIGVAAGKGGDVSELIATVKTQAEQAKAE